MDFGYPYLLVGGMEFPLSFAKGTRSDKGYTVTGTGTLEYCRTHDIQIQAYAPLHSELLKSPEETEPQFRQVSQHLKELAAKKQTGPSAVAVAWLLCHPTSIVPIIGSTNPAHIAHNCVADRVVLSNGEWYAAVTELPTRSI